MHDSDTTVLRDYVVQCAQRAFSNCSIDVELHEGDACEVGSLGQIVAFIGFGGPRLRGTLTIMAPEILWRESYPLPRELANEPCLMDLLDWSGEVVNQVMGRIKNQLAPWSVDLGVSTPKAMHADPFIISQSSKRTVCVLRSPLWTDSFIGVWFDAVIEEGGPLFGSIQAPGPCAVDEGELLLF